jgi:hypothetical protein
MSSTAKGSELIFLKRINNDGLSLLDVDEQHTNNKYVQDEKYEINCLSMTNKTFVASGGATYIVKFKNLFGVKPEELKFGQKVYHKELYNGKEEMTVRGITEDKVLLEGDYSGGTHNVKQEDWLPIDGVRIRPSWYFNL